VPKALEAVILKAMERNPARRYDSASVLADDLEQLLSGELGAASGRPL
jgi:serine/threonine-protein kinase